MSQIILPFTKLAPGWNIVLKRIASAIAMARALKQGGGLSLTQREEIIACNIAHTCNARKEATLSPAQSARRRQNIDCNIACEIASTQESKTIACTVACKDCRSKVLQRCHPKVPAGLSIVSHKVTIGISRNVEYGFMGTLILLRCDLMSPCLNELTCLE